MQSYLDQNMHNKIEFTTCLQEYKWTEIFMQSHAAGTSNLLTSVQVQVQLQSLWLTWCLDVTTTIVTSNTVNVKISATLASVTHFPQHLRYQQEPNKPRILTLKTCISINRKWTMLHMPKWDHRIYAHPCISITKN